MRALLQGDIFLSIQYHSLVFYAAVVIGAELVSRVISRAAKNPRLYQGHEAFFIYTATDLVLANWLFKNYMLAVRGIDLLPAFGCTWKMLLQSVEQEGGACGRGLLHLQVDLLLEPVDELVNLGAHDRIV